MPQLNHQPLMTRIESRRDELIALTQDLVRIPTTNPPGDCYADCVTYVGERLAASGFELDYFDKVARALEATPSEIAGLARSDA